MTNDAGPTLKEWQDLRTIVYQVEAIVEVPPDEPAIFDEAIGGGLLGWPIGSRDLDSAKVRQRRLDRHVKQLTGLRLLSEESDVLRILPGLDRLGSDRSARIEGLRHRLLTLPAYRWLHDHLAYQGCIKTLEFLSRTKPRYAIDTREFVLLHALIFPIQLLQIQRAKKITPQYPTRAEFEKGYRQVRDFSRFLSEHGAIMGLLDISLDLRADLEKTVAQFESMFATYRKPRDDGTLRERGFLDSLIPSLTVNFGDCSLALLEGILAIVDISFDRSDLQTRIKSHRSGSKRRAINRSFGLYHPPGKLG